MQEIELKFSVPDSSVASIKKALRERGARKERLLAFYFDTVDARLAENGASLRLRKEGKRWVQTAKAKTGQAACRLEENVPIPAPGVGEQPQPDLRRHDGSPVGKALRKALGCPDDFAGVGLSMRFQTDVVRTRRLVHVGDATIEVAFDVGTIEAEAQALPVRELEFELKSGNVPALVDLASCWVVQHGLWINASSKAERGAWFMRGDPRQRPVKAPAPVAIDAKAGGRSFFIATLRRCLAQVLPNASGVASDDGVDEELVHQLRVGIRRLRTALRELQDLAVGIDPEWEPALQRTFLELGEHRDLAVVVPGILRRLEGVLTPELPAVEPPHRVRHPRTVVRDPVFQRTLLALVALESRQPPERGVSRRDLRAMIAKRLGWLRRRIGHDGKRFAELDTEKRHKARKNLKRLRYLSEFTAPLFAKAGVEGFLDQWKEAQDTLGEYNDQRIAVELFRKAAERDPNAWFAVGWLEARQSASVELCRKALARAAKTAPFWET